MNALASRLRSEIIVRTIQTARALRQVGVEGRRTVHHALSSRLVGKHQRSVRAAHLAVMSTVVSKEERRTKLHTRPH